METGRPHPIIRPELIVSRGNLRTSDIGITWQGSDTFLHGVQVAGPEEDIEDTRHRPATSTPYPPVREHPSCGMSTPRPPRPVCQHTEPAKKDVRATDRRHLYSGSTTKPSGGRLGSVISKLWLTHMDGIKINKHYRWSRTSTRKR